MDKILSTIEHAVSLNIPFMVVGETGVGKTTLIKTVADKKKKKLSRVSINGGIGTEDILGKFVLENGNTKWVDGVLITAMKKGDWVVFDELNAAAPEVLFALHGILDHEKQIVLQEKDGEVVKAHKDFRFFATMNPVTYAGTRSLNAAFMSRFVVVEQTVLPIEKEAEVIMEKTKVNRTVALELIQKAEKLRKMKQEREIAYFCSTRDLLQAAALYAEGAPKELAFCVSVINKLSPADLETLVTSTPDYNEYINTFDGAGELEGKLNKIKTLETDIQKGTDMLKQIAADLKKAKDYAEKERSEMQKSLDNMKKEATVAQEMLAKHKAESQEFKQKMLQEIKDKLTLA